MMVDFECAFYTEENYLSYISFMFYNFSIFHTSASKWTRTQICERDE